MKPDSLSSAGIRANEFEADEYARRNSQSFLARCRLKKIQDITRSSAYLLREYQKYRNLSRKRYVHE
jgi:hypothetical protein